MSGFIDMFLPYGINLGFILLAAICNSMMDSLRHSFRTSFAKNCDTHNSYLLIFLTNEYNVLFHLDRFFYLLPLQST